MKNHFLPITFTPPAGSTPGQTYLIDQQLPTDVSASGLYDWSVHGHVVRSDGSWRNVTATGQAAVVVNDFSPYGAGWGLQSTSRLVFDTGGDVLLVQGSGDARTFLSNRDGTFVSPTEDFGTLSGGECAGGYSYVAKDQTRYLYDLNGRLTRIVLPNAWQRTYSYTHGLLTQVTSPGGSTATLAYNSSSGLLPEVDEAGGRSVALTYDANDNLTGLTDAAGPTRQMSYDAYHHLTEDRWAPNER